MFPDDEYTKEDLVDDLNKLVQVTARGVLKSVIEDYNGAIIYRMSQLKTTENVVDHTKLKAEIALLNLMISHIEKILEENG